MQRRCFCIPKIRHSFCTSPKNCVPGHLGAGHWVRSSGSTSSKVRDATVSEINMNPAEYHKTTSPHKTYIQHFHMMTLWSCVSPRLGKIHIMPNMSGIVSWLCQEFRGASGVIWPTPNSAHQGRGILGASCPFPFPRPFQVWPLYSRSILPRHSPAFFVSLSHLLSV